MSDQEYIRHDGGLKFHLQNDPETEYWIHPAWDHMDYFPPLAAYILHVIGENGITRIVMEEAAAQQILGSVAIGLVERQHCEPSEAELIRDYKSDRLDDLEGLFNEE